MKQNPLDMYTLVTYQQARANVFRPIFCLDIDASERGGLLKRGIPIEQNLKNFN